MTLEKNKVVFFFLCISWEGEKIDQEDIYHVHLHLIIPVIFLPDIYLTFSGISTSGDFPCH